MGSRTTGRFQDYPGSRGSESPGGGGGAADSSAEDQCERAINGVALDDIARCSYYEAHNAVPSRGTSVRVRDRLYQGRIAVEAVETGEVIGFLPTAHNYLLSCINAGYRYGGTVASATDRPVPTVTVNIAPEK